MSKNSGRYWTFSRLLQACLILLVGGFVCHFLFEFRLIEIAAIFVSAFIFVGVYTAANAVMKKWKAGQD